jgi:tetratricopeptide (TPR) repeat protein
MPIQINSPGWRVKRVAASRGAAQAAATDLPGLPPEFLTDESRVAEEAVLEPAPATRGREAAPAAGAVDLSYDLEPGQTAVLAIRHPSGALTFHPPVQSISRGVRGPSQVQFHVPLRQATTRGLVGTAIKTIVIKVAKVGADKGVSFLVPRLVEGVEKGLWRKRGLKEGWLKVSKDTLAAGRLEPGKPVSPARSLLFIHGTFSNAASAFRGLAASDFFDRIKGTYGDRIFAFDHFSLSRTPEENARMLLDALPEQATTFDVVTHSRGGLVVRNLVERTKQFGDLGGRFKPGRVVLVASPNEGTPLATPKRFDDTIGWIANLLEIFPDNPFTSGAAFVANGLVWLANHASGDIPGLRSMDADGDLIAAIQGPPGPPADAYSALVANYQPTGAVLQRLLDVGADQFFGTANDLVVPSEGGWRIDRLGGGFIPAARIACFGPGGNLPLDSVTHVNFFSHAATADFLINALLGRPQSLNAFDPRKSLPARRLLRGMSDAPAPGPMALAAAPVAPAAAARRRKAPEEEPLKITVTNGDLTFEPEPLLLGHYRSTRLTGTEGVMDKVIGGAMGHSLRAGLYPSSVGSHQIFINARPNLARGSFMPRPKAVIVVGLGEEGKLQAADLANSVRLAVIAWAQRLAEDKTHEPFFKLATTLIGSGGTGVTAGEAARLIAHGVSEANAVLKDMQAGAGTWPRVNHLHFIELYLDRAADAWRALRMQEAATPGLYDIVDRVEVGTGPLQRPVDTGYRGADYDFITIETKEEKGGVPQISYTLDTKRARSEVRGQRTQSALIRELVATASSDQNRDQQIGHTLFTLLVPVELEAYLAGSGEMVIALDAGTARIPWELLDHDANEPPPWALRVKLLRKLRIAKFREYVTDADADACALVIGEPECPGEYPRLYGARREADAVRTCLTQPGALDVDMVTALISADVDQVGSNARDVVNTLFEKPWRIVHIAGHGMPGENGKPGGVVLSTGFLGPDEIRNMRAVPELVFVNCCHLAGGDANQLLNYDRASFASGVAGALIEIGVRCVIAAGWAVDDDAASVFANTFYASLLQGRRFIDAVDEARKATYALSTHLNTWAAYQCYGDPDWVFRQKGPDANRATEPSIEDFSGVASAVSLKLALERIIVRTKFQGADVAEQLRNLAQLEKLFGSKWGRSGDVAELLGQAFVEAGDVEAGLQWYERAVAAPDAQASIKAAEQLANVRARLAWEIVEKAARDLDDRKKGEKASGQTARARAAARRARLGAERSLRKAITRADRLIAQSLELLTRLIALEPTMERASLIGAAYKRGALVDGAAGRRARVQRHLRQMRAAYQNAQELGEKSGATNVYYPAANRLTAEVALHAGTRGWRSLDRETASTVRKSLQTKSATDPDFWSVVGETELDQYEALAARKLAPVRKQLSRAYDDLHKRVTATRMWSSVYDTACLVLPNYASRATGKESAAAHELLAQLRSFAHPDEAE